MAQGSPENTAQFHRLLEQSLIKGENGLTREAAIKGYVEYHQSRAARLREPIVSTKSSPQIQSPLAGRPRF